jgi:dipeptidyl-peptidase-4
MSSDTEPRAGQDPEAGFARQTARTQRFTLGAPRNFAVAPDGSRVAFLRSPGGTDRMTMLWVADLPPEGAAGTLAERVVADPRTLHEGAEELSQAERARRERSREGAGGIVGFATDKAVATAAFALSGELHVADLAGTGGVRRPAVPGPVVDPRPDPTGRRVAYVSGGVVRVVGTDGSDDRELPGQDAAPNVTWGLAEFIAAEEMGRSRGFWWAPDGSALLIERVDTGPVLRWHLADPANPERTPVELAYPAAGTPNAIVGLHLFGLDGTRVDLVWDTDAFPYLAAVHWSGDGPPLLHVQSRDQRETRILAVDLATGGTEVLHADSDPVWVELVDGVPAWAPGGRLVRAADADGARRLYVGAAMASGDLQVRGVLGTVTAPSGAAEVLFSASDREPAEIGLYRTGPAGPVAVAAGDGVHLGAGAGRVTVVVSSSLDWYGRRVTVRRGDVEVGAIASLAETPPVRPGVHLLRAGPRAIRTAVLLPTGHVAGSARLPVLMDPYGGPHAQRVLRARNTFLEPQWWADQGFAVVVADGRGTPGRGPEWERAVAGDLAGPVLEDQVEALHVAAEAHPDLDLSRVGIRGWSFGGYLAALAVLRRPDVFHAAVAGAPVTDWALYDTHYTERYLGMPQAAPEAYATSSLLGDAAKLERPLLLVHGLADDNVVAAHTLRLSAALLAAGRPHQVLPLSGVTHMTPQEVVAENLLLFQLDFLRRALGLA